MPYRSKPTKTQASSLVFALFCGIAILFAAGCNTTSTSSSSPTNKPFSVELGTSSIQVLLDYGKPQEIKQMEMDGAILEVWVYKFTREREIFMSIEEQALLDEHPTFEPTVEKSVETIEVIFDNERVVTWSRKEKQY